MKIVDAHTLWQYDSSQYTLPDHVNLIRIVLTWIKLNPKARIHKYNIQKKKKTWLIEENEKLFDDAKMKMKKM